MKHIKAFNESKESNMSTEDLLIDLKDYGFKIDSTISNYKLTFNGDYNISEVIELYYDSLLKIQTFKDISNTSFITKDKLVTITYDIIEKVEGEQYISISLSNSDLILMPYSFAVYAKDNEIYYLIVNCKNSKGNVISLEWYDIEGIKNGKTLTHTIKHRKFKINKEDSEKILKLIETEKIGNNTVIRMWDDSVKKALSELTADDLSNI
jgi:hypothetical protein